jgi:hypothetical protein
VSKLIFGEEFGMRYKVFVNEYYWGKKYLAYDLFTAPSEQRDEAEREAREDFYKAFKYLEPESYEETALDKLPNRSEEVNVTVFHWFVGTRTWG